MTKEETGIHLSYLDGWRGIAVLLVVFGHFWGDDHIWTGISSFGVDIFFVLSGRLMAEILFVRKSSISVFFVRRISRILPAFITFVIVTTLAFRGSELSHGMAAVAVALTMTLNYAMIYAHPIGLFDHLWSLCVEEHAYIILAGVAFCSRRRTFRVGLVVALVGFAALINGVIRLDLLGNGMLVTRWRSDVSVAGIFIAAAFWLRFKSISLTSLMSPLALAVAVICRFQDEASLYFGVSTIALAIAVVKLDDSLTMFRRMLSFAPLKTLGLWSFSLYLWQQPFYKLHRLDDWSLLMTLSCTFICALISFYIIERPTRRLINARFDEVRQRQACEVAGALP